MAVALDRLGNALIGGSDRETFSERAARARKRGARWGRVVCAVLEWLDPGHCGGTS